MYLLRHILSILLLPVTMIVVVPYLILSPQLGSLTVWPAGNPLGVAAVIVGVALMIVGLAFAATTIRKFATIGRGTLAPWDPPRHLVVSGIYRHVRNPMISGFFLVLLGEALAFRSQGLLIWAAIFFAMGVIFIPLVEEPLLERRFGEEYREYRRNVPRWVPRVTAWKPPLTWNNDQRA